MKVSWTRSANQRLAEIARHIAHDNPDAARRTRRVLRDRAANLGHFPKMGRASLLAGFRELVVGGTPWILTYLITENEVFIVDVRHAADDWLENP